MSKKREIPRLNATEVAIRFSEWLKSEGPLKGYSRAEVYSPHGFMQRIGPDISLTLQGLEQIFSFRGGFTYPENKIAFPIGHAVIYTIGGEVINEDGQGRKESAALRLACEADLPQFTSALSNTKSVGNTRQVNTLKTYFDGDNISARFETINFGVRRALPALSLNVPIIKLRYGRSGHLSGRFFKGLYEAYAVPGYRMIAGLKPAKKLEL